MLKDKYVLNQFENMMIEIILNRVSNDSRIQIIREDGYVLICVNIVKYTWFNFVLADSSYGAHIYFKSMPEPSNISDDDICDDKQQIQLFIDYLITPYKTLREHMCNYKGETVPLLAEKLYCNSDYCAIVYRNKLQFVQNNLISQLPSLITEEGPIELNKYQVNKRIKGMIKSSDEMESYGFRYIGSVSCPHWIYFSILNSELHIEFSIRIFLDSDDVQIDVLDNDFCQPYDYQAMMDSQPYSMFPRRIFHDVDKVMHDLQNNGFISGYSTGMYV